MTLFRSWFSFLRHWCLPRILPPPPVSTPQSQSTKLKLIARQSSYVVPVVFQYFFNMSKGANLTANDMNLAAARVGFHRLRFEEGYVFRTKANSLEELTQIACSHYWWGEDKPSADEIRLTTKSRRGKVFYLVEAAGYPKNINTADDF